MTKQQLQLTDMVSVVLEYIEKNIKSSQKNNELLEKSSASAYRCPLAKKLSFLVDV